MNTPLINYANAAILTLLKDGPWARFDTTQVPWLEPIIESLADCGAIAYSSMAAGVFIDVVITHRGIAELPWLARWT